MNLRYMSVRLASMWDLDMPFCTLNTRAVSADLTKLTASTLSLSHLAATRFYRCSRAHELGVFAMLEFVCCHMRLAKKYETGQKFTNSERFFSVLWGQLSSENDPNLTDQSDLDVRSTEKDQNQPKVRTSHATYTLCSYRYSAHQSILHGTSRGRR